MRLTGLPITSALAAVLPTAAGELGTTCELDEACNAPWTCFEDLSIHVPFTLGALFGIPAGAPDPAYPGEYLPVGPSEVPVSAFPGGACTDTCVAGEATCGECGSCERALGGPRIFADVGLVAGVFSAGESPMIAEHAQPAGQSRLPG